VISLPLTSKWRQVARCLPFSTGCMTRQHITALFGMPATLRRRPSGPIRLMAWTKAPSGKPMKIPYNWGALRKPRVKALRIASGERQSNISPGRRATVELAANACPTSRSMEVCASLVDLAMSLRAVSRMVSRPPKKLTPATNDMETTAKRANTVVMVIRMESFMLPQSAMSRAARPVIHTKRICGPLPRCMLAIHARYTTEDNTIFLSRTLRNVSVIIKMKTGMIYCLARRVVSNFDAMSSESAQIDGAAGGFRAGIAAGWPVPTRMRTGK